MMNGLVNHQAGLRVNMDLYQQTSGGGSIPNPMYISNVAAAAPPAMYTYPTSPYAAGYYYQPSFYNPGLTATSVATTSGYYNTTGAYICCEKKPSLLEEAKEFLKDRFKRREKPAQHYVADINVIHNNVAAPVREEVVIHHRDPSVDSATSKKATNTTINIEHKPTIINDYSYVDKSTNTTTNHYH
jgi:hypothetical protein